MRVTVDIARCEGHGLCEATAPDVFVLDEADVSTVRLDPIPADLIDQAEAGVQSCPVAALRLDSSPTPSSFEA